MRQIEFRGKRIDNGEWVCGDLLTDGEICNIFPFGSGWFEFNSKLAKVNPSTVGQFTGLTDKNGNKIFEGDIINGNHKDLFLIEEFNGGLQMYNSRYYRQRNNELIATPTCDPQTKSWLCDSEVIGNIHDNQELLNQQQ